MDDFESLMATIGEKPVNDSAPSRSSEEKPHRPLASCLPCSLGEEGYDTTTGKDDASSAVFSVLIYRETRQGNEGPHKEKTRD